MSFFGELSRRNVFRAAIAAWTEFERRMAQQLAALRAKDKPKPAFEF